MLCYDIWQRADIAQPSKPRASLLPLVDIPDISEAVADALKSGEQALIWWWNGLSSAEKILAAAVAEIATEEVTISEEQIIQVLSAARLYTQNVEKAFDDLVKRRVLDLVGEREYRFTIELFRRWVHTNKSLRKIRGELDQFDSLTKPSFETGMEFFRRRQWATAANFFKKAFSANHHHFHARLYMGKALLELGQIDEAAQYLSWALSAIRSIWLRLMFLLNRRAYNKL